MLSTVSTIFSSSSMFDNDQFPALESGFKPWDYISEPFSTSQSIGPVISGSVSYEPTQDQTNLNSSLNEPNQLVSSSIIDERKKRRMISNRESARRSRMRKQRHLENIRNQVNRLRLENRELSNRLRFVLYHCNHVTTENDRLRSEYSFLRRKLSDIHQISLLKQLQQFSSAWPCNDMSDQTPPLMIT